MHYHEFEPHPSIARHILNYWVFDIRGFFLLDKAQLMVCPAGLLVLLSGSCHGVIYGWNCVGDIFGNDGALCSNAQNAINAAYSAV